MNKLINLLFSMRLMLIMLLIFAVALGAATFIEDSYDTVTARLLVYNAKWFEVLMLLMALNFIGNINKYKLFSLKRATGLIMHLAFIVMIIGAGITRYTGFEGTMHIREGEASNVIYSEKPYFRMSVSDGTTEYTYDRPLYMSSVIDTRFKASIETDDHKTVKVKCIRYIKNAQDVVRENMVGGKEMAEITVLGREGNSTMLVSEGEVVDLGDSKVAFNSPDSLSTVSVTSKNGQLTCMPSIDLKRINMGDRTTDTLLKGMPTIIEHDDVLSLNGVMFAFTKTFTMAKRVLVSNTEDSNSKDALIMQVDYDGRTTEVPIFGGAHYFGSFQDVDIDGIDLKLAYGWKPIELPFSLRLNDFILDRYSGSMSPSSFASEVELIDDRNGLKENHRIFMNNVLDYQGFRFFQSSYDQDEKGTILSVNHDFYGTWVSYFGYFLMALGFLTTLFNRNSRFISLRKVIKNIRSERKSSVLPLLLMLVMGSSAFSQESPLNPVSSAHAARFGHVLVQSRERFEPIQSLAYDVLHKISRKDDFETPEKGKMDGMQVFLDMLVDAPYWRNQKMIYVREKSVRDVLGIEGKYASFNDFYETGPNATKAYKLSKFAENAFRKKQKDQNKFDKEIIKVDERVNICMMVFNGNILKIFPDNNSPNNKWVSWDEKAAKDQITGAEAIINEDLKLKEFNCSNIFGMYVMELVKGTQTGDYDRAETILGHIESIQRNSNAGGILPSKGMIEHEISYNRSHVFEKLRNWYGMISMVLLILAFVDNLKKKKSKVISVALYVFIGLLGAAFIFHTYGMAMRWYLTGHAPWSNGYEALLLMGWGSILAGFTFIRNSKITLAATGVLSFFMLMTAGLSSYDPQLTNLQPVLKSYWLIIHVAVITISYGFLGLGFILGLINLAVSLFKNKKNRHKLDLLINELTHINEISLTVGLMLVTIGTFLGGIWANESWGRYWGWDAKETWSLIMVITYTMILHFRLVPKMKGTFMFNTGAVLGFGTLLMTFIGVNYYLSKGLHSYASGDTPVFPLWAWGMIVSIIVLILAAGYKDRKFKHG